MCKRPKLLRGARAHNSAAASAVWRNLFSRHLSHCRQWRYVLRVSIQRSDARMSQDLAECATEFHVKDGVNERIEEAVDVAEPDEEREQKWVQMTDWTQLEQVVPDADGVDDVDSEERHPTEHKRYAYYY